MIPYGNPWLVGVITVSRGAYWRARMRIRQWGRLPLRRGPTVLAINHQHEDEAEIICERAFAQGPWRKPVFTASSRRMFEPGFFATRLPALRFARTWDASGFMYACGLLPIENELSSRPLGSIAHEVARRHGDLALAALFRPGTALPAGARRCSDLATPALFEAAQRHVKLAAVVDPYRGELLRGMRDEIEADLVRMESVVRAGFTFFVAPEGFYSTDGRMRPLRGIIDRLAPIADVWMAAIAFDPFRGRRLSLLYRVLRPADPADLRTSLAAARPVTTSALLAARLVEIDGAAADTQTLVDAVAAARDALPAGTFVDPELRDARRCVQDALENLRRRGTLVAEGAAYRLGPTRTDPRFPAVADVVAYQATFFRETVDAARRLARAAVVR